jgi:hypothetical protein
VVTKEFIKELERARNMFDWSLTPDTGRFSERRASPRLRLRATLKGLPQGTQFDPIGAVCFAKTAMEFSEDYWVESAVTIGLGLQDARDIMASANDLTWRTVGDHREPDPYKQALRQWMVQAAGFSAAAAEAALKTSTLPVQSRLEF